VSTVAPSARVQFRAADGRRGGARVDVQLARLVAMEKVEHAAQQLEAGFRLGLRRRLDVELGQFVHPDGALVAGQQRGAAALAGADAIPGAQNLVGVGRIPGGRPGARNLHRALDGHDRHARPRSVLLVRLLRRQRAERAHRQCEHQQPRGDAARSGGAVRMHAGAMIVPT
jgi:hypothetical protein